jgi:hypothetical protein
LGKGVWVWRHALGVSLGMMRHVSWRTAEAMDDGHQSQTAMIPPRSSQPVEVVSSNKGGGIRGWT